MIQRILPAYYFTLECVYLYFLLFMFYTRIGEIPSILGFIVIVVVANVIIFFSLKQKQVSGSLPYIGAIILGGVSYVLGFTPMSAVFCTVFFFFRISSFIKDSTLWKEERNQLAIIFYCSAIFLFIEGWILKYPHMNWLFATVIIFSVLLSVGSYLQKVARNSASRNVTMLFGALGISVILTGIVTLLIPVAKWLFFTILEGLALLIGFVLMPFFDLFEGVMLSITPQNNSDDEDEVANTNVKKEESVDTDLLTSIPIWVWGVIFVIVLVAIWFLIRKKRLEDGNTEEQSFNLSIEHIASTGLGGRKRRFFREPGPNEYIRKLLFQLQIYAEKFGMGRYEHETIREWFERVGFQKNEDLYLAYESVRYGNNVILKQDAKHLEIVINDLKHDIKERSKKGKDKEA